MTRTLLHPLDNSGLCRAVGSGAEEDTQHERDEREELPVRHPRNHPHTTGRTA